MGGQTRRSFATRAAATLSGAALLTAAGLETTLAETKDLLTSSSAGDIGTDYWRLVRRQFRLDPGLVYLNNASLGPSPALVADATETFRRTLDGFPSRYMWGGWSDEKETVREKAAGLLGASPEEIALIHNTTEGMNLVASSLDLEPGDEIILADHEHPSGTIPWQYWQEPQGVKLVRPTLPILPDDPEEIFLEDPKETNKGRRGWTLHQWFARRAKQTRSTKSTVDDEEGEFVSIDLDMDDEVEL